MVISTWRDVLLLLLFFLSTFWWLNQVAKKKHDLKFPEINEKFCACVFQFKDILHYCASWQSNGHPFGHAVLKISLPPIVTQDFSTATFRSKLQLQSGFFHVTKKTSTPQKRLTLFSSRNTQVLLVGSFLWLGSEDVVTLWVWFCVWYLWLIAIIWYIHLRN